jgi:hypothetical protein
LPTAKAENLANNTASSATQCRSSPVSGRYLPKREYFKKPPETFEDLGRKLSNWESGDRLLNRKSPPLAGFSAVARGRFSSDQTAWLTREDSNFHITIPRNTFEMSAEFLLFWPKM